jgi:hypothetical protein
MAHPDIRQRDASSMKNTIGVLLCIIDERRHEIACIVVLLLIVAAVWAALLAWTQ